PASSERYQLTDIDGEAAFIRIGSITMVRVPLEVMEPVEEDDE
ncbi:transcriptional regulator, partial [Escherichia coli]